MDRVSFVMYSQILITLVIRSPPSPILLKSTKFHTFTSTITLYSDLSTHLRVSTSRNQGPTRRSETSGTCVTSHPETRNLFTTTVVLPLTKPPSPSSTLPITPLLSPLSTTPRLRVGGRRNSRPWRSTLGLILVVLRYHVYPSRVPLIQVSSWRKYVEDLGPWWVGYLHTVCVVGGIQVSPLVCTNPLPPRKVQTCTETVQKGLGGGIMTPLSYPTPHFLTPKVLVLEPIQYVGRLRTLNNRCSSTT